VNGRQRSQRDQANRWTTRLAEISVLLSTLIALLSIFSQDRPFLIAVVVPLVAFGVIAAFFTRRLYSVRTVTLDVALGGPPGAGKTVYVNVLCARLMEEDASGISFIPEASTAQFVYRTIGMLRKGEWPSHTSTDSVRLYRGTIGRTRQSSLSLLLNGRIEFDLEVADSAGEHWQELAHESVDPEIDVGGVVKNTRLIDSTFFERVVASAALFYFVDARLLFDNPSYGDETADDLLSTVQLLRVIQGVRPGDALRMPVAVILSKVDLLTEAEFDFLSGVFHREFRPTAASRIDTPDEASAIVRPIERLMTVLYQQLLYTRTFILSSTSESHVTRVGSSSRGDSVVAPLRWSIEAVRHAGGRRSRWRR